MKKEKAITSGAIYLFYDMFREGSDITSIAKETGYTEKAVRHWIDKNPSLKKENVSAPSPDCKTKKRGRPPIRATREGIEDKAVEMHKKGVAHSHIAKELGVSGASVLSWLHRSSDPEIVIHNNRGKKKTPELETEAVSLYKAGESSTQIAARLGVCSTTVRNWLHDSKDPEVAVRPKGCGVGRRAADKIPEAVLDNMELPAGLKWTTPRAEVRIPVKKTFVQRLVGWTIDKLKKYQKEG